MIVADLGKIEGRFYPARRRTQNLRGGASPIQGEDFAMGFVRRWRRMGGRCRGIIRSRRRFIFVVEGDM